MCAQYEKKKMAIKNMSISDLRTVAHLLPDPRLRVIATNHGFIDRHKIRLLTSKIGPKKGFAAALDTRISIPPY